MSRKYDAAYLDWDGVIWDFKQAFCDWYGYEVPDTDKWEFYESFDMPRATFELFLAQLPQNFWQQEKYITPHAHDLVRWARANADKVFILTVAPEWSTAQGKQNLARKYFDLGVYTVAKAEEKVEFAKDGCLLIDDNPSPVVSFKNASPLSGGYVWPTKYNEGLDAAWYFKKSWLYEHTAHWALNELEDRADILKDIKPTEEFTYSGDGVRLPELGVSAKNYAKAFGVSETAPEEKPKLEDPVKLVTKAATQREVLEEIGMKPTNPKDIAGSNKVPVNSMISGAVKAEIAAALLEGALKYGRHNYRKDGVRASVYYDACGRHSDAWWEGQDVDPESGINHLSKAIAGLMILRDCQIRGYMNDDRPPKTIGFLEDINEITRSLIEKYPKPESPITEISLKKEREDA